ncbi:prospero homeobox protein 2 [Zootoca vivipara]|uniref:prospero homeobox protein 2 n=1 Tax=Zootoca vivipara TaxID=8524 RepID=UPI00158FC492|nr:prospero homeobox protein 2 [Zootoca vivipara]
MSKEKDMNGNPIADHYDYRPTSGHAGGQKGDTCVERDCFFSPASYYASIISHLLSQPEPNCELDPSFLLPPSQKTELLFQSAGNGTSSRDISSPSPDCGLINSSQFHNEHLQAKRARVEHIIRGMSLTPNPTVPGIQVEREQHHLEKVKGSYRENKRKQRVPQQQQSLHKISLARAGQNGIQVEECLQVKKQLHVLQQQLKQLQEWFALPYELNGSSPSQGRMEKTLDLLKDKFGQSLHSQGVSSGHCRDRFCGSIPKTRGSECSEKGTRTADSHSLASEDRALSEILKHELIQVVTQAVDSVLKQVLPESPDPQPHLPSSPTVTVSSTGREFTGAAASAPRKWLPKISSHKGTMSVATEKPPAFPSSYPICSKMERKPGQVPPVNYPLVMTSEVQGNGIFRQMLLCGQNSHWGSPSPKMVPSPDCLDGPWRPIKLKSSVMRHQPCPTPCKSAESLASLPASNAELAEMQAMMDGMYFPSTHIQEALTPGHLKKAKLMFFFSRYPTSSLLKTYFLDVQFTRCITSQLIKWFSNFREFYYIQMEKFARQAILEDVTDPSDLIVTRDSELFRILNVHYNKGNDFEVPDGFLDVASLTLQEFFSAVRAGKDLEPSWKKPIYKIISKLDSEIPDAFKSSTCPKELNQG